MKNCYFHQASRAIVDLCDYYGRGLIITRINVPPQSRGQGIASDLLKQVCHDADVSRTILWLEIMPSGGLNYDQLEAWYRRYGFENVGGIYRRMPMMPPTETNAVRHEIINIDNEV